MFLLWYITEAQHNQHWIKSFKTIFGTGLCLLNFWHSKENKKLKRDILAQASNRKEDVDGVGDILWAIFGCNMQKHFTRSRKNTSPHQLDAHISSNWCNYDISCLPKCTLVSPIKNFLKELSQTQLCMSCTKSILASKVLTSWGHSQRVNFSQFLTPFHHSNQHVLSTDIK